MEIQNIPSANPKTGRITAQSVIAALRKLTAAARGHLNPGGARHAPPRHATPTGRRRASRARAPLVCTREENDHRHRPGHDQQPRGHLAGRRLAPGAQCAGNISHALLRQPGPRRLAARGPGRARTPANPSGPLRRAVQAPYGSDKPFRLGDRDFRRGTVLAGAARAEGRRRSAAGRAGARSRHQRTRVFLRLPAPGHAHRGRTGRPEGRAPDQRTHRRRAGLRPAPAAG